MLIEVGELCSKPDSVRETLILEVADLDNISEKFIKFVKTLRNMNKTMMLVQATWQESQTFRMIPTSSDCPYVECIFDPGTKVFVIISKIKKVTLHMLPKIR